MPEEVMSVCFCPDCGAVRFEARLADGRRMTYGIAFEDAIMLRDRLTRFKTLFERRRQAGKTRPECCEEVPRYAS